MPPLRPRAAPSLRHVLRQAHHHHHHHHHQQYRSASTSTSTPTSTTAPTTATATATANPSPPHPKLLSRYRRALLWTTLGLTIGLTTGTLVTHTIAPPPHPLPGSREDSILLQDLNARLDANFKVKVLRGKCSAVAASLRGDQGTWKELAADLGAGAGAGAGGLTGDALAGARALGAQRVFWNPRDAELVAVVWFGGAASGWPGVTHGGAIATVLDAKMALVAALANGGADAGGGLSKLELHYKKPTYANAFYVLRCKTREGAEVGVGRGGVEVEAQLETLEGVVCVSATGTVDVGDIAGSAGQALESLTPGKSWLGWTSRSDD